MDFSCVFKENPYHDEKGRFSSRDKAKVPGAAPAPAQAATKPRPLVKPGKEAYETPAPANGKAYTVAEVSASIARLSKGPGVTNDTSDGYEHSFVVNGKCVAPRVFAKAWVDATGGKMLPEEMLHAITGDGTKVHPALPMEEPVTIRFTVQPEGSKNPQHVSIGTGGLTIDGIKTISVDRNYNFATKVVDHTYFAVEEGQQGSGMAKALFKSALPVYDKHGFEKITTHANLDAGGYAWGRFGFRASDPANSPHFVGKDAKESQANKKMVASFATGAGAKLERVFKRLHEPLPDDVKREVQFLRNVIAVGKTPGIKGNEHAWREFPRAYANASVKAIMGHLATSPNARVRAFAAILSKDNPRKLLTRGIEGGRTINKNPNRNVVTRRHHHWFGELDLKHGPTRKHLANYLK